MVSDLTRQMKGNPIQRHYAPEAEIGCPWKAASCHRARLLFCQLAVADMGYPRVEAAHFLGVTTSAVVDAAHSEHLPELKEYL